MSKLRKLFLKKQSTKAQSNTALACHQKSNPIMTEKLETKIRNTEWNWCTKWQCGDLVRNKNWMLSPSCGFAMLDGCLGWCGGPWGRCPCARMEVKQYAELVDSWRCADNYHAMASMLIPTGFFPTGLSRPNLTTISRTRSEWTGHCSGYGLRRSITMPSAVACFHGGAPPHTVHLQWRTVAGGNSF